MKKLVCLLGGIALMSSTLASASGLAHPANPPQAQNLPMRPRSERHPQIRAAMQALQNAKRHLESAAHDFQGHRVKAIQHIDEALEECRLALQSDVR